MKPLWFLGAIAGLVLASPAPPPSSTLRLGYDFSCGPVTTGSCAEVTQGAPPAAPPPRRNGARPAPAAPSAGVEFEPPAEGVRLVVSIPQQKLWVFRDGELYATSPVSTGRRGHETPVGRFRILQKDIHHRSNRYSNAPMPYMQRLTSYGIALHGGHLPGYPASHGCIRLPHAFARKLYGVTDYGTRVTVTRARPRSAREALRLA